MTSYFDDARTEVREIWFTSDEEYLGAVAEIEERIIADVNLVTGDREFPDDLREQIQGIIAIRRVRTGPNEPETRAREMARVTRSSLLISDLHTAFHVVAQRRVKTRFGLLSDNPRQILAARDEHDGGSHAHT